MEKTHFGSIKFTTKGRVEFPYMDDIVKRFEESVIEYCKKHNIPLIAVRINVNVLNQEIPIINLYTHTDYLKNKPR